MRIRYQNYKMYPELAMFPSDEQRVRAVKAFQRSLLRRGRFWLLVAGWSVFNSIAIFCFQRVAMSWFGVLGSSLAVAIPAGLLGGGLGLLFQFAWRKPGQRALRRDLLALNIPICLECGYDLRGQTVPRCPECGQPFDANLLQA